MQKPNNSEVGPKTLNIKNNIMLKISSGLLVKYISTAVGMDRMDYKNNNIYQGNLLGTSFVQGNALTAAHSKSNSKDSSLL